MIVLAQEVTVNVPPDQVGRIVSLAAVVIALGSLAYTAWQGQALRRIETTQHEWEKVDRISASVEVIADRHLETNIEDGRVVHDISSWLRLRNSGRAPALDVEWEAEIDVLLDERQSLEILHPGEHYDVYFSRSLAQRPGWLLAVKWTDERGRHSTERRIG